MFSLGDLNFSIGFDWSWVSALGSMPAYKLFWFFWINGGWILFLLVFIWGGLEVFKFNRQLKFLSKQKKVFLAIDIPRTNLQSPKAVENIFSALAGAHMPLNWEEEFFEGQFQIGFSLEIISIDGFVQYVARVPVQWRHLFESAIYSQYPDAEISEVEDYTKQFADIKFPNDEYNMWGSDLVLYNKPYLPIRCYSEFEHPMSKDIKDPLITLIEIMSKLRPGEQFWYQLMVYPTLDPGLVKEGSAAIRKMIGLPAEAAKATKLDKLVEAPIKLFNMFSGTLLGFTVGGEGEAPKERPLPPYLPPLEKLQAEGIARKISQTVFKCKARILYIGKKEVFNKGLGVSGTVGAFKQFNNINMNGFKPDWNKTQARWWWWRAPRVAEKQNKLMSYYRNRDAGSGSPKYPLSIEELATIYHFPYFEFQAPLVKKIESKKVSAPVGLPIDFGAGEEIKRASVSAATTAAQFDKRPVTDYDNDYFEQRFALDPTGAKDRERKDQLLHELNIPHMDVPQKTATPEQKILLEKLYSESVEAGPTVDSESVENNFDEIEIPFDSAIQSDEPEDKVVSSDDLVPPNLPVV